MDEAFCLLQTAAKEVIILIVLQSLVSRLFKDGGQVANIRLLAYLKQKPMFEVDDWQTNIYLSPSYALDFVCEKKREKKKFPWVTDTSCRVSVSFSGRPRMFRLQEGRGSGAALKSIKHVSGKSDKWIKMYQNSFLP